jgi:thiamine biosynthesis lipoprotein
MTAGPAATGAPPADDRLHVYAARAMGSPLRLAVTDPGSAATAAAWAAVRDEFEASEAAMSRFRETSEITRLNRLAADAPPSPVSRRLRQALMACDRARRLTDGRFDPRVLLDLERLGDPGAPIDAQDGSRAGSTTRADGGRILDWQAGGRVRLAQPVDLGGIGKGLALRWAAAAAVERLGPGGFLLEAGGDLVAVGGPPGGGPWRVGLEDPAGGDEPLAVIETSEEAVVTSSVRRRHWLAGDRVVHHLIDPRTGEPGETGLLAVTVAGPDPAWSEVWSKSLFLEGQAGIALVARRRGLAAWWVADDGSLAMTPAARARTIWVAGEGG